MFDHTSGLLKVASATADEIETLRQAGLETAKFVTNLAAEVRELSETIKGLSGNEAEANAERARLLEMKSTIDQLLTMLDSNPKLLDTKIIAEETDDDPNSIL